PMLLSFSGQGVSCFGGSDGSASIVVTGGTSGYTYLWSNGSNGESISNLSAGNYQVTVIDNNGCTDMGSYIIASPSELNASVNIIDVSAPGEADGYAAAVVLGGIPGYNYLWSTGETTETINNLSAGNYSLTVTDENGCSKQVSFIISLPPCGINISVTI